MCNGVLGCTGGVFKLSFWVFEPYFLFLQSTNLNPPSFCKHQDIGCKLVPIHHHHHHHNHHNNNPSSPFTPVIQHDLKSISYKPSHNPNAAQIWRTQQIWALILRIRRTDPITPHAHTSAQHAARSTSKLFSRVTNVLVPKRCQRRIASVSRHSGPVKSMAGLAQSRQTIHPNHHAASADSTTSADVDAKTSPQEARMYLARVPGMSLF